MFIFLLLSQSVSFRLHLAFFFHFLDNFSCLILFFPTVLYIDQPSWQRRQWVSSTLPSVNSATLSSYQVHEFFFSQTQSTLESYEDLSLESSKKHAY